MNRAGRGVTADITQEFQRLNKSVDCRLRKLKHSGEFSLKSPVWAGSEGFEQGEATLESRSMSGG
jgi:hypothetical protein